MVQGMTTPKKMPVLDQVLAWMNTRAGNAFLVLLFPLIVAALGLPTGVAKAALALYEGVPVAVECPPCPACLVAEVASVETAPVETAPALPGAAADGE